MWRICYEGHREKQADILVSSDFPILLETSLVSSFFSTIYKKHDFAPDCLCLHVVCDRSKMIGLPQSNFKLKNLVFNRMRLSIGNVYIGPYSPVKWLRSGFIGRWQEGSVRTTLVSHSPGFAPRGMLSIKPFHSKEDYISGFSLHQSRLYESGIFSVSARPFWGFTALRFCINTLDTAVLIVGAFHQPSGELWQLPQVSFYFFVWFICLNEEILWWLFHNGPMIIKRLTQRSYGIKLKFWTGQRQGVDCSLCTVIFKCVELLS